MGEGVGDGIGEGDTLGEGSAVGSGDTTPEGVSITFISSGRDSPELQATGIVIAAIITIISNKYFFIVKPTSVN